MRSVPCLFSNPPKLRDGGFASGSPASVAFRRLPRRSRRDDSVRTRASGTLPAVSPSGFPAVTYGFPLAGRGSNPADVYGYYWSGTPYGGTAYSLDVSPTRSTVDYSYGKTALCSVRCVRAVTAAEFASAPPR